MNVDLRPLGNAKWLPTLLHAGKLDVGRLDKTVDHLRLHVVVVGGWLDAVGLSPAEQQGAGCGYSNSSSI